MRDAERKTLIITISLAARLFTECENCRHRQQICCKTLARSSPAALVLACKSRKLTFPKFTKRLKKLTRLSILLIKFRQLLILFSRFPKSTNVRKFPLVSIHKRREVPSVLNQVLKTFPKFSIRFSKSSLSSQSCSPGSLGPQMFSTSSLSSQSGSLSSLKVHSFTLILNPVLQVQKRFSESSRSSEPCSHTRSPCSHFVPKSVSLSAAGEHEALDQMAPRDRVGSGCSVWVG